MFMQSNYVRVLSGCGYGGGVVGLSVASALVAVGGFAPCEAFLRRVAGVSDPRVVQFPPIGDGAAAVRGGMAPKSQTTSVKDVENGVLWARWSTFWAHQCLAVVRCSHVNPLLRVLTRTIARKPAMWSVGGAAQARMSGLTCA